ncbi:MAG: L,D-transpeptidase [Nitrospira sp.]|nr:L,D-transpeptidase [Nitrospira sp.]
MRPDLRMRTAGRVSIVRGGWPATVLVPAALLFVVSYADTPKKLLGLCAVLHPSDERIDWECRTLRGGESLERLFGERWADVARFNRVDRRHAGPGVSIKVPKRVEDLAEFDPLPSVYPPAEGEAKFILIDLSEQFLGAYEYGALRFSLPITSGPRAASDRTPTGEFRLSAAHRRRRSSLYTIEGTDRPYPMNHALRFYTNRAGVSYWIHGRDVPGYPASHGCIGLYDEPMQKEQYGVPRDPELTDAKRLFEWVLGDEGQDDRLILLPQGPKVHIIGRPPKR